jgi:hypothetical protein
LEIYFLKLSKLTAGTFDSRLAYLRLKIYKFAYTRNRHRAQVFHSEGETQMNLIGLVAVVMAFLVPLAGIYAWYETRRLRTRERLAAIEKGVAVPMAEELPPHARSRKAGLLLTTGGLGYVLTFVMLGTFEREAAEAAVFGMIPIAIGIGYFIDFVLLRRELHPTA